MYTYARIALFLLAVFTVGGVLVPSGMLEAESTKHFDIRDRIDQLHERVAKRMQYVEERKAEIEERVDQIFARHDSEEVLLVVQPETGTQEEGEEHTPASDENGASEENETPAGTANEATSTAPVEEEVDPDENPEGDGTDTSEDEESEETIDKHSTTGTSTATTTEDVEMSDDGANGGDEVSTDSEDEETIASSTVPEMDFSADPTSLTLGETTTLSWTTNQADTCEASGADVWSGAVESSSSLTVAPDTSTTYVLSCANTQGTTTENVTVEVTVPEDVAVRADTVRVTEVLFDPGPSDVQGTDNHNEWIEIYNYGDEAVDMSGWSIGDGTATDVVASKSLLLPAGEYLIVTRMASTDTYWVYGPGTVVVHLDATLGSAGLSNAGESVLLYGPDSAVVDAVSWGDDVSTMNPSVDVSSLVEGESIKRTDILNDTDTASDWEVQVTPTPGA